MNGEEQGTLISVTMLKGDVLAFCYTVASQLTNTLYQYNYLRKKNL